jgi:hypothetical protein
MPELPGSRLLELTEVTVRQLAAEVPLAPRSLGIAPLWQWNAVDAYRGD